MIQPCQQLIQKWQEGLVLMMLSFEKKIPFHDANDTIRLARPFVIRGSSFTEDLECRESFDIILCTQFFLNGTIYFCNCNILRFESSCGNFIFGRECLHLSKCNNSIPLHYCLETSTYMSTPRCKEFNQRQRFLCQKGIDGILSKIHDIRSSNNSKNRERFEKS